MKLISFLLLMLKNVERISHYAVISLCTLDSKLFFIYIYFASVVKVGCIYIRY